MRVSERKRVSVRVGTRTHTNRTTWDDLEYDEGCEWEKVLVMSNPAAYDYDAPHWAVNQYSETLMLYNQMSVGRIKICTFDDSLCYEKVIFI